MPLAHQIRDHAGRVQDDLRAGHDYYEHTKAACRMVGLVVSEGRSFRTHNIETGTIVDEVELVDRAQTYVSGYLAESVFQHYVSLFEDFVFGLIGAWLTDHPGGIPQKDQKPVDLATIVNAPDKDAIIRVVVDRELNRLKYERPSAWFKYLNDRVKLGLPTDDQGERLTEIKASRDILAHNRGIVKNVYLDKAGSRARYTAGQRLEIQEPYLRESWLLIREVVQALAEAALAKA